MNTAAKRLLSSQSLLLQRPSNMRQHAARTILRSATTTGWMIQRQQQQQRHGHGGVIDPHRLRPNKNNRKVPTNKLLQAIRKNDQQAVWTQYLALHEHNQLKHLLPEYHSMTLRALGLQNLVSYGPDEILAIKERLLVIWANMKHHGHRPDIRDYNHMLGFAGRASDWALCERTWRELLEKSSSAKGLKSSMWGLKPNVYSYNSYMMAAIRCQQPGKVAVVFNTMQQYAQIQPNASSYSILMDAYGHLGDLAEVDRIFDRAFVRQQHLQQPKQRISHLLHPQRQANTALGRHVAFTSRHAPTTAGQQQQTLVPTEDTFLALIDAHGRFGNHRGLDMIYTKMMPEFNMKPTLGIYNALIRWFCAESKMERAKELLVDMKENDIEPNVVTFNYVFRHEAIKRNRPGVAERILDIMYQMHQLRPLESMYRHLIRIHTRHNREDEVARLTTAMKSSSLK